MKEDILDADLENQEDPLFIGVQWWEKKRLIYNLFLIGTQIIMMLSYSSGTMQYGLENAIIDSLFVAVIANGFYCIGWGLEILVRYYFNYQLEHQYRITCYIIGTGFSVLLAFITYGITLNPLEF